MKPYGQDRSWIESDQERKSSYSARKRKRTNADKAFGKKWKGRERQKAQKDTEKAKDE